MITPAEHEARNRRFAKILLDEVNRMNSASTPAGGGDVSPAAADRATSLACTSGEAAAVAPPKPEGSPAAAGADDWQSIPVTISHPTKPINYDDDTDDHAFPRSRRIICSASSDGQVTIKRENRIGGESGITLTATEARTVREFLQDAYQILERATP